MWQSAVLNPRCLVLECAPSLLQQFSKWVPRPAASAAPENLLEMQMLRSLPDLLNEELWAPAVASCAEKATQGTLLAQRCYTPTCFLGRGGEAGEEGRGQISGLKCPDMELPLVL